MTQTNVDCMVLDHKDIMFSTSQGRKQRTIYIIYHKTL